MLHVLLIDDEASARADLRAKLSAHPDVVVVGEAATVHAARALLTSADYDVVFLDVQLIGGESFQLLPEVRPGARIVFATAHDSYALRAFECGAADYLLKPIDPARLAAALRRGALARTAPPCAPASSAQVDPASDAREELSEVALTPHERVFLRQCIEAWENSLPATHPLRAPHSGAARLPREVRYVREAEPTRLFLAGAHASRARRWWRAIRSRFPW